AAVEQQLSATMVDQQQLTRELHDTLTKQLIKLDARAERLIDLAADGLLPREKITERSNRLQIERQRIQAQLADTGAQLDLGAQRLRTCLALAKDPVSLYEQAPDQVRRQLNQTFYERFYLDDEHGVTVRGDLNPP